MSDEALRIYQSWANKTGVEVPGYGLYERTIFSKRLEAMMPQIYKSRLPEWELLDFYQFKFLCDWDRSTKQKNWLEERKRNLKAKLSVKEDSPPLYSEDELPLVRYECTPMKMLYRAGMGWGLF